MIHKLWVQVSAGDGPVECCWAVVEVLKHLTGEAAAADVAVQTVGILPGSVVGTAQSVLLELNSTVPMEVFLSRWKGTVQWVARSPFRPQHRRKNWFVGVELDGRE